MTNATGALPAGPFVRGAAWPAGLGVAYPRADPADMARLPTDTWTMASVPAGVRLELVGDATAVRLDVETTTDDLGYRGAGAGTAFVVVAGNTLVDQVPAALGRSTVELRLDRRIRARPASGPAGTSEPAAPGVTGGGRSSRDSVGSDVHHGHAATIDSDVPFVIHLPEGMKPVVHTVTGVDGGIEPAPPGPRWLCYGDSIAEGWVASGPPWSWPARVARRHRLDLVNLGYAGAARGEIPSAEQIAALDADVISLSHGTNCWSRTPHSAAMVRAGMAAFLEIVRQGHPDTPIVVVSPVVRPDAEDTPNRLGATLADLRAAIEDAVTERAAGDARLHLVPGAQLLRPDQLPDGIHPGDEGHATLADAVGPVLAAAASGPEEAASR